MMKESHYRHLIAMAALSFLAMHILMYAMVNTRGDVVGSLRARLELEPAYE